MNAHITNWITVDEANIIIKKHIEDGTFEKKQIKKSSYRWVDTKDHSKGYLCRVVVESGIHPELELEPLKRGRKKNEQPEVKKPAKKVTKKATKKVEAPQAA